MRETRRRGLALWPYLIFLALFAVLLTLVLKWYLLPAMQDTQGANQTEKKYLAAHALLLMYILLFILALGLLLAFRINRPMNRVEKKSKPTTYTDAWAESAKRMQTPKDGQS